MCWLICDPEFLSRGLMLSMYIGLYVLVLDKSVLIMRRCIKENSEGKRATVLTNTCLYVFSTATGVSKFELKK